MNILQTKRTYASYANAEKALKIACDKINMEFNNVRYLIAVNKDGRYAPVVVIGGQEAWLSVLPSMNSISFAHVGVMATDRLG